MIRRALALLAAFVLALLLLAACSSARVTQGTSDESCYLAIPTAADAVGTHAKLDGVRKFTVEALKGPAPKLYAKLRADGLPEKQGVCLVAYDGRFNAADVTKSFGRSSGTLAVAAVKTPGNELLGTLILKQIPVRFRHTHPF